VPGAAKLKSTQPFQCRPIQTGAPVSKIEARASLDRPLHRPSDPTSGRLSLSRSKYFGFNVKESTAGAFPVTGAVDPGRKQRGSVGIRRTPTLGDDRTSRSLRRATVFTSIESYSPTGESELFILNLMESWTKPRRVMSLRRVIPRRHAESSSIERLGVSVVNCCHNSGSLLLKNASIFENISESPTLCTGKCSWSTRRRLMARGIGAEMRTGVLMRVVPEPRLGLRYADEQGFKEARYEVVQFCRRQMGCAGEGRSIKQGDVESSRGGNDRACQSSGRGRTVSRFGFFAIASSTLPEHLGNLHRISTMLNRARMTIRKMSGKISKETTLACD
jgi:hypothetical protein